MNKILIKLIFTFITVSVFIGCSSEQPTVVKTETVTDTTIVKKTVATGSIVPRKEVNVKSQVSGIVEKLYVVAGVQVKEGDVIAKIKIIPNMLNLANAENRLNAAQINYDNSKIEFDRNKSLLDQSVISKQEFQQYELRLKTTNEEVEAAKNQLQIIKEGVAKSSLQSSNTLVKSTISGMILDVPIKEGGQVIESNTFNEGTTICSVANMSEMIFEGKLDESEVGKINMGNSIELTIGAIDKIKFNATLEYISPKGINEAGAMQFVIKAKINTGTTDTTFLRAGYSANADIILAKKEKVLAVSESVLQFEGDKTFVEVLIGENKYEKRFVKTGLSDAIVTEVVEGLKKGEKIKVPTLANPNES
jgi:HlyD family secretion protein